MRLERRVRADAPMVEFLSQMRALKESMGRTKPDGWHYSGVEDFLLQHGTHWIAQPLPPDVKPMQPKMCFENAYRLASRRKDLRYVEGMATTGVIPILHAWCVDRDGKVIDPTWARIGEGIGSEYFGVVIPLLVVRKIRSADCVCVIDNWIADWPLLRQRFDGNIETNGI